MFEKLIRDCKDWFISNSIEEYEIQLYNECNFSSLGDYPDICGKCNGSRAVHIIARTLTFMEKEDAKSSR